MRIVLYFLLSMLLPCAAVAQIDPPSLESDNIANIPVSGEATYETEYCRPGVRNRSQSRGVAIRYERQGGFDWRMNNAVLEGDKARVTTLEQFTFKFKVPVLNKPGLKLLFGYEWDTEKYFFDNQPAIEAGAAPTMWQLLDERRLKATKISGYLTKSFNDTYYVAIRGRLSLQGDYDGLTSFAKEYRTYSGGIGFGKKISEDEEIGLGVTYSTNKARNVILPFFFYNKTWNDRWGLEAALPAQIFLRHNVKAGQPHALKFGAKANSKFYVINSQEDKGRYENFNEYYLRSLDVKILAEYEHRLGGWCWAFLQGGMLVPINARFNSVDNVDLDLRTKVNPRPFFRVGLFIAPPKDLIR